MKKLLLGFYFSITVLSLAQQAVAANEEYVYQVVCEPKQFEDIARVVKGSIWLALRSDPTVAEFAIDAKVQKLPAAKNTVSQTDLLKDLGFQFNSSDLSVSLGAEASGFACFTDANLKLRIQVKRKDGSVQVNEVLSPIRVPGTYATKSKVKRAIPVANAVN